MQRRECSVWVLGAVALGLAVGAGACRSSEPDFSRPAASPPKGEARPAPAAQTAPGVGGTADGAKAGEAKAGEAKAGEAKAGDLLHPPATDLRAPARYSVELDTARGKILIDVTREWAPRGADRLFTLVRLGYFKDVAFFRVVSGFMAQWGIHGDPAVNRVWRDRSIADDPVREKNARGMVSFATAGPNTRSNQLFINFGDNTRLDAMGFSPVGKVRNMDVVDRLYAGYGEGAPQGRGPAQGRLQNEGNAYLKAEFPELDYVRSARIVD